VYLHFQGKKIYFLPWIWG